MHTQRSVVTFRSLRLISILSILVPLVVFSGLAAFRYYETNRAAEYSVARSLRVAHEHATKVLSGAEALQDRLFDVVNGKSVPELKSAQVSLHELLKEAKERSQVQSVWIIGADGSPIASSGFFPAPDLDVSDRTYFKFHQTGRKGRFLAQPIVTLMTKERIVDLSVRFDGPDGAFGGVINVSLLTDYFQNFYEDVVAEEPGLAINLFHEDGPIFARWPVLPNQPERLGSNSPVMARVKAGEVEGQVRGVSSVDGKERLIAFKKIGNYPLYAGTGISLTAVRDQVLRDLAIAFGLMFPLFLALFFASRVAVQRTRESIQSANRLEEETLTRRRAEEALLQAQKLEALGRLTGGVAHDFNNALMVISNSAFLLKRNVNETGAKQLQAIGRAVDAATKLTRQLLAFSRRQALVAERVDLKEKLPAISEMMVPMLGSQVQFLLEVAPDVRPIVVDSAELELALLNLSINARDAMPSGGSFSISARNGVGEPPTKLPEEFVVIEARDTGIGIEEDVLAKVFDPFFTTKPVGHGTGLGLSQVYGFCERAGGMVKITSVVGSGTIVSLFFPAATPDSKLPLAASKPVNRSLGRKVLVVEDINEVAEALLLMLEALGCQATRVPDGPTAMEWLDSQDALPDLVLTDVMMPGGMDGIELARVLRSKLPQLPVLLMTGYAERLDAISELGFQVLPKPFTPESLSEAIARLTRHQPERNP